MILMKVMVTLRDLMALIGRRSCVERNLSKASIVAPTARNVDA